MRLKGKLVDWEVESEKQIGTIELEPGEITVGSEVLTRVKIISLEGGMENSYRAEDGEERSYNVPIKDIVAVLPQEPEKKEIEPIRFSKADYGIIVNICEKLNELIKIVNEMRKK